MVWDEDLSRIEPERTHSCTSGDRLRQETDHARTAEMKEALWGHAVTRIEYAAGQWWAHNEEYSSVIGFRPWCGEEWGA
jgi:hypothetical protein